MALFSDSTVEVPGHRRNRGWLILFVALAIGVILGVAPAPYVIEQPGPVYNTLGTADHDGAQVPLVTIPDEPTYPTAGSLDLLTVSVVGNPGQRFSWFDVLGAWSDSSKAVLPIDQVFPPDVTVEQRNRANQVAMVNSQKDAIAAALVYLGYDFPRNVKIVTLPDGSPSAGILRADDEVLSVNGEAVHDLAAFRTALAANGTDAPATLGILRGDHTLTVQATPVERGDAIVLDVKVSMDYSFPFAVDIQLDNVGGPSAGMMFALGIVDKLTPGELNGGENVAGTGTIDSAGSVGAIGGIRQKMYGAKNAGADWFLAPASNCDEVTGHVPDGLTVFAVKTLDDSVAALDAIAGGADTSALPRCSVG
ncbi:YlbL family protein [Luethyella okanaganae]|uniref:endopeptidase La n=1 Tax=Luethyella okanaganae TaxID=69372 RepID=A0ABW1VBD4_9MICO